MISATQREAIDVLRDLCAMSEDIRLGQLMAHLGFVGEINAGRTLWDIEDEQLLEVMCQHRAELATRLADATKQNVPPVGVAISSCQPSSILPDQGERST